MSNYLWHQVSEQEKEKIRKETQELLQAFSRALAVVDKKKDVEGSAAGGERTEQEGKSCDPVFREKMFANAPKKNKDFILGEKKGW